MIQSPKVNIKSLSIPRVFSLVREKPINFQKITNVQYYIIYPYTIFYFIKTNKYQSNIWINRLSFCTAFYTYGFRLPIRTKKKFHNKIIGTFFVIIFLDKHSLLSIKVAAH